MIDYILCSGYTGDSIQYGPSNVCQGVVEDYTI